MYWNDIIKQKIRSNGLINFENDETALFMKTIKLPNNISKINLHLPKKQYSKDHNIEQMMKNPQYEIAKKLL